MALLIVGGIVIGLYLRHNSRERVIERRRARDKLAREARGNR